MPIYEYKCLECGHEFELLLCVSSLSSITTGKIDSIGCPKCRQDKIERIISLIANTPNKWKV